MKILSFTVDKHKQVGILDGDKIYQASWQDGVIGLIQRGITPNRTSNHYTLDEVEILAPLIPGKIVAVGRNYAEHAAELGNEVPAEPLLFAKYPSSVIGQGDAIRWNTDLTQQVDWEGELAVIIGKQAHNVSEKDAYNYVYGYTIANDVSARDLQNSDGQWARAKGMDTFCPLGPWIVTCDEIPDPHNLTITTLVNGEQMQHSNTGMMIYKIPQLIAYCSKAFTLFPGDILLTGTPSGVGKGMKPPRFLAPGDAVTVQIEGIGELKNHCE